MKISINKTREALLFILIFYSFFATLITDYFHIGIWQYYDELIVAIECIWLFPKFRRWDKGIYIIIIVSVLGILGNFISKINIRYSLLGCYTIIKSYLMFYVFYYFNWKTTIIKKILRVAKWCYAILIFCGYLFILIPSIAPFKMWGMDSICNHPAVFGTLMVPMVIYSVVKFVDEGKTKYGLYGLIAFSCVILARTSKNIISLGLVMLIYLIRNNKKRKYVLLFVAILGIGLGWNIIMGTLFKDVDAYLLSDSFLDRPRIAMYVTSFMIGKDFFPFGSGFGTYASTISRSHYSSIYYLYGLSNKNGFRPGNAFYTTDSYWPSIIGETGFIGLALFIVLICHFFKLSSENLKLCKNKNEETMFKITIMIFACLVIESLFTSTFMGLKCFFGISLLGISNSIMRQRSK